MGLGFFYMGGSQELLQRAIFRWFASDIKLRVNLNPANLI